MMGVDQNEARRQRAADSSKRHPFVAMEHRVLDSPAYADLAFSSRDLLVLMARQLTRDNNGNLQATFTWCQRYGFGSEHTLRAAIVDLLTHGFIYRTRSHGANGAWARYALTWLPIKKPADLFLAGFKPFAYRDWQPSEKKSTPQKLPDQSSRKCSFTPELPAESAGKLAAESADYESCCHGSGNIRTLSARKPGKGSESDRLKSYLAKLSEARLGSGHHAGRVRAHLAGRTLQ